MTYTNQTLASKFGAPDIYDAKTKLHLELPQGLKIFNRKENTWIGGSEDGSIFLLVERLKQVSGDIPTILAEGDLNLFLCTTGPIKTISPFTQMVPVGGSFSDRSIQGHLAQTLSINQQYYLVLVAVDEEDFYNDPNEITLELIQLINAAASN